MATTEFFRCYGASNRADKLVCLSSSNYLLIFGFDTDEYGNNMTWRKYYDHKPSLREIKQDISDLVNTETDAKILTGFTWNSKPVYLSTENQQNYKAAYDLAVQTSGATLPVKFKLGEDENGNAVYHTFEAMDDFTDFYSKAIQWVYGCIADGWKEKDNVDYDELLGDS